MISIIIGLFVLLFDVLGLLGLAAFIGAISAHRGKFEWSKDLYFVGYKIEVQFCQRQPLAVLITKRKRK